jgi:hypothetical protein
MMSGGDVGRIRTFAKELVELSRKPLAENFDQALGFHIVLRKI